LLEQAGHRPFVVAGRGDPGSAGLQGVIIPEIDSRHPDVVRIQNALRHDGEKALQEFRRTAEHIRGLMAEALGGADVCIVHNAFTLHKNLALTVALAQLAERKDGTGGWIAWCHDLAWNNPLYLHELLPQWPWTLLKYPLPNVTYVAISERRRQELATLFQVPPEEIALVPNGIDPTLYIPSSPETELLRTRLEWDKRDWVFLAPVRVTRRKNLELAINIIAAMRDMGTRPLLMVTGPPGPHNVRSHEYMHELLDLRAGRGVEDEVVFLALEDRAGIGAVSDDLMARLYWWADAALIPSSQEGFGLPLLEAGLARLPVFCSDIPVLQEVGGHDAHYFSPDGDPVEIAAMILKILNRPGILPYRRKVLSTYGWERIFESRIVPLLEEVRNQNSEYRIQNTNHEEHEEQDEHDEFRGPLRKPLPRL
jgi:glycosyltransferase involved in cell wall biosynthesis